MSKSIFALSVFILFALPFGLHADVYDDAVNNPARSAKDREVDERRKPAEILRYFEITPGMRVFDVFAGGGYYSEIISYLVGSQGSVALYNNAPWDRFVAKSVEERLADNRLPNVNRIVEAPEAINAIENGYDAAIFVLGMHDLYYVDADQGWVAIDRARFLKNIYKILKPGAVFGVIDANAEHGADNQVIGQKLHRADPKVMIEDLLAAGFEFEGQSDLLANAEDDKTTSVFLPINRYNTDRSVLKFRKPK
jgi:predicted methyltransferase